MRITEVHLYKKVLPIAGEPYTMAGARLQELDSTIVQLVSDTGTTGWGETCPLGSTYQEQHAQGARAALRHITPGLIGESLLTPKKLMDKCDALLLGHNYAKAAIDIAAMDLLGQHYQLPLCDLLGGAFADSVPAYCALGIAAPEDTARTAVERIKQGYQRLQIKIGGRALEQDIETMHRVWEQVGHRARLVADANRSLTTSDALLFSASCSQIPLVLEQPCNSLIETISIRQKVRHPLYLDESTCSVSDVLEAISQDACDGFGFKLTRLGGINAFATVRDICAARSMPHTCDDSWGGDIIAAACVHLGATVKPELLEGVWISAPYIEEHYDPVNAVRVEKGRISVPRGNGLGITPDPLQFGDAVFSAG